MFGHKKIFKTRTRSSQHFCIGVGIIVAILFSFTFTPGFIFAAGMEQSSTSIYVISFLGLTGVGYLLMRYYYGVRTWINEPNNKPGNRELWLRSVTYDASTVIPCDSITRVELCEYDQSFLGLLLKGKSSNEDHCYHYKQPGYRGPGLRVSYLLPPQYKQEPIEKTFQFPVNHAEQVAELIGTNIDRK